VRPPRFWRISYGDKSLVGRGKALRKPLCAVVESIEHSKRCVRYGHLVFFRSKG
jgi:hypothetical protein